MCYFNMDNNYILNVYHIFIYISIITILKYKLENDNFKNFNIRDYDNLLSIKIKNKLIGIFQNKII